MKKLNLVNNYLNENNITEQLLKLSGDDIKDVTIDKNKELMKTTLRKIYSNIEISPKYSAQTGNYNEELIKNIYKSHDAHYKVLQNFFKLTFKDFYDIYTAEITKEKLSGELTSKKESIGEKIKSTMKN